MASKKENIKALFSNTRTRIILVFTIILVVATVTIGFVKFSGGINGSSKADLRRSPGSIDSIPGSLDQTEQYASLQMQQNVDQAAAAAKKGSSSIPTIIRSQAFGEGIEEVGAKHGKGSVGFSTLAQQSLGGPQYSLWFQNVQESNCSKESIDDAMNKSNASLGDIRQACSCTKLKDAGFKLDELKPLCACKKLKKSGFRIKEFKKAGYSAADLRKCGFTACEERSAGFTAQEMKDAGFSDGELKGAGFTDADIARAGGIPDGVTLDDIKKAGCSAEGLKKLRAKGVSAAAIRRTNGCSAAQMKAAGFSPKDLKDAGFTAAELRAAGFSPEELKKAGYSARDLLNAGFTPDELKDAGFTEGEIRDAENVLPPGFDESDIRKAGCSEAAIKRMRGAGVSAALIAKYAKCSAKQLKSGGFSDNDLARDGLLPKGVSQKDIAAAGCDPDKLKALVAKGVTAKQIRDTNGCNLDTLKKLGFSADDLLDAGFTPEQLISAGFPAEEFDDSAIRSAGCDPDKIKALREKGVSAKRIKEVNGCSAEALKAAGFSAKDLAAAGFTPADLLAAGFTPDELKKAGVALTPAGVIAAGRKGDCSVKSLRAARAMGVSAATIKETLGCSAAALKRAGYSAAELKAAGFTAAELKDAGFSPSELKAAGFSAKDLRDAGFSADELKAAGFSAKDLKNAGFSAAELKAAGFSAKELKDAGFSAKELKNAGFGPEELRKAGYSAKELRKAGFSPTQLKNAGFSDDELQDAGVSRKDSAMAGLDRIDPVDKPDSGLTSIPSLGGDSQNKRKDAAAANAKRLQEIMEKQKLAQVDQKNKQQIQQRMAAMVSASNQLIQGWNVNTTQQYQAGNEKDEKDEDKAKRLSGLSTMPQSSQKEEAPTQQLGTPLIRMGDIMFAVVDTAVNTDEPGPILATIVTGSFKGGKLIGSFNLPSNADKMVVSFNTLTMPGAPKSLSISAFAIDPNTGRTALASEADHHYLERYGSLFASTFLEGFGNAFQSADTTIQVGGTGGVTNTTVQNGIGRSALENAVIGLATVGKAWAQVAQQNMSRPTTVQIYSGTAIGVLFTQDLRTG